MRKRYKIILNLDIDDPDKPYPAGGDYNNLSRLRGIVHAVLAYYPVYCEEFATLTLDKIIDKGEIIESEVGHDSATA